MSDNSKTHTTEPPKFADRPDDALVYGRLVIPTDGPLPPDLRPILDDHNPDYNALGDEPFFTHLCRQANRNGHRSLELGCGSGRLLTRFARMSLEIDGLDPDKEALGVCKRKLLPSSRTRLFCGTLMDLNHTGLDDYGLIYYPFNSLQRLRSIDDHCRTLVEAREHLIPNGVLAIVLWKIPYRVHADLRLRRETTNFEGVRISQLDAFYSRSYRVIESDDFRQEVKWEFAHCLTPLNGVTRRFTQEYTDRYFTYYEVRHLLARTGFTIVAEEGSYDQTLPMGHCDSHTMIFLAKKA